MSAPEALDPRDLVEIHQIERLKHTYLRCLDQKLWDELADTLTDDVDAAYSGGAITLTGRDAVMTFLVENMGSPGFHSSHHCHHPEIDLSGAEEATGVWAMEDTVLMTDLDLCIRGAGFYEDRYRKVDGRWRIAATGYRRLWEEIAPRGEATGIRLTASWWSTGGRSTLLD